MVLFLCCVRFWLTENVIHDISRRCGSRSVLWNSFSIERPPLTHFSIFFLDRDRNQPQCIIRVHPPSSHHLLSGMNISAVSRQSLTLSDLSGNTINLTSSNVTLKHLPEFATDLMYIRVHRTNSRRPRCPR